MIKLGVKATDVITGFTGIITGRAEYLTGCIQYVLCPPVDKDGKLRESEWFDENRIMVDGEAMETKIHHTQVGEPKINTIRAGGPQRDAPKL